MSKEYCVTMMFEDYEIVEANSLEEAIERATDNFTWAHTCTYDPEILSVNVMVEEKFKPVFSAGDVVVVNVYITNLISYMEVGCVLSVNGNVVEVNIFGENAPLLKFVDGLCEFNTDRWELVGHATYDDLIKYIKGGY